MKSAKTAMDARSAKNCTRLGEPKVRIIEIKESYGEHPDDLLDTEIAAVERDAGQAPGQDDFAQLRLRKLDGLVTI